TPGCSPGNPWTGELHSPKPNRRFGRSLLDLPELRAFQRQVVHQSLVAEHEADDRVGDAVRAEILTDTELDDRDAAVDTGLPAVARAERFERGIGHEHQHLGTRLAADLEAERSGGEPVVLHRPAADQQRPFTV